MNTIKEKSSQRKIASSMIAIYLFLGGTQYIVTCFTPIYLNSFSFSNSVMIGLVMSAVSLISSAAGPIWGIITDRAKTKNLVLSINLVGAAIVLWLLIIPNHTSLTFLLMCLVFVYLFISVPPILSDTIIAENYLTTGLRFSVIKSFSSLGASLTAFLVFVINLSFEIKSKFYYIIVSALYLLSLISLISIPKTQGYGHKAIRGKGSNLKDVLKNRRFVLLLSFGLCHYFCINCYNTFFSVYYSTEQGLNAGVGLFGLFYAIAIMGEAIIMVVGAKFINNLNVYVAFLLAPLAGIGRCMIAYFAKNPYIMMSAVVFQAFLFGPLTARLAPYIQKIVPKEIKATSQSLWSFVTFGIGAVLGSAASGAIVKLVGIHNLFLVVAVFMFLVLITFAVLFRKQYKIDMLTGVD